jgi:hypothetical protein
MNAIARDTWRAVLVVVVAVVLREVFSQPPRQTAPPPQPAVYYQTPVSGNFYQPQTPPPVQINEPERPLRRVGGAFVDLADALIGIVRR